MLVTAHHLFGPAGGFEQTYPWDEVPGLIRKVSARSIGASFLQVETSDVLPIFGAHAFDEHGAGHDLAVFPLTDDAPEVPVLPLAERLPRRLEKIWMLAHVLNRNPEKKLYPACVVAVNEHSITYVFEDSTLDLTATSGAPMLNGKGEIMAMNVAGVNTKVKLLVIGTPATTIRALIKQSAY
ncbi:trypsin-like peptidase domain-containing protein [Desulfoluna spongiiphila]|uniref:Trypsin-like peptidase domain-containing protein n=1 Tax=Desulfoluna spongiiphila TaxID=419481 RepID=A0A1G5FES8_9BACT|nr:trypsin-like peptidase domain-containing protein [Desulfoluna spongiiphila]SCY37792.1 Trypsin-like peptidase domain-containing protein [Desulfoluna spongiiphila]